jgi:hypothetical protein
MNIPNLEELFAQAEAQAVAELIGEERLDRVVRSRSSHGSKPQFLLEEIKGSDYQQVFRQAADMAGFKELPPRWRSLIQLMPVNKAKAVVARVGNYLKKNKIDDPAAYLWIALQNETP